MWKRRKLYLCLKSADSPSEIGEKFSPANVGEEHEQKVLVFVGPHEIHQERMMNFLKVLVSFVLF
jgi:hypothetical protein